MRMLHKTLKKTSTMTKIMTPRGKAANALSDNHGLGTRTPEDTGLVSKDLQRYLPDMSKRKTLRLQTDVNDRRPIAF